MDGKACKDRELLTCVSQEIFNKKGQNILALDTRAIANIADYVIIAEGVVDRHVIAIADSIMKALEKHDIVCSYCQGYAHGDWIVLDCSWVIIHLLVPEMRDKYHLEGLWPDAEIIDIAIQVSHSCA